ncbi:MAG: hypothetical protein AAF658_18045, partial [Myxococcota bacterium]
MAALVLLSAGACSKKSEPAAHIRAAQGVSTVTARGSDTPVAAAVDAALFVDDLAQTGADGTMTIEFAGGNSIELQPNTTVQIKAEGAEGTSIGAIVIEGQAKARSSGGGITLKIGLPFDDKTLEIGTGPVEILLGSEGMEVLVGSVEVLSADGSIATVGEGEVLRIGGVVINLDAEDEGADVVAEPVVITLLSNPKYVEVKRSGENSWSKPKKTDQLAAGDAVRTQRKGAILAFDDKSQVRLGSGSELTLESASKTEDESSSSYALNAGRADVSVKRTEGREVSHTVALAGSKLAISPGMQKAQVSVKQTPDGKGRVEVQFGRAVLEDGTVVGPGQALNLEGGKASGEPIELAATDVQLRTGMSSVVYYSAQKPAVVFSWKPEDGAEDYNLELSKDKSFEKEPIFRERLDRTRFVYEDLEQGAYYWRVKGGGGWKK